jgi:triphosphatase
MNSGLVTHFIGPGGSNTAYQHQTMSTMQEIELKFQIPEGALAAIQAEMTRLNQGRDTDLRLRAAYFDTPDRLLGAARMALRVRQEGDEWVQTLKAGGSNTMMRLEANCPAQAPDEGQPILADLSRHMGTPAQEALERVLHWSAPQDPQGRQCGLIQLYATDITRTRAHITVGQGTTHEGMVELALDLGHIHAGSLSVAVRELEIELISGHPMAVIHAGRDWVNQFGLWLDTQTKAHRGDRLARLAAQADAPDANAAAGITGSTCHVTLARPAKIAADATPEQRWRAELESCLEHLTGNLSELGTAPADTAPVASQWQLALQSLIAFDEHWSATPYALPANTHKVACALSRHLGSILGLEADASSCAVAVDLARSGSATSLCLDLLSCLMPE